MNKIIENIPVWSIGYIFNDDQTGLTDEEVSMIDEWLRLLCVVSVLPLSDEEGSEEYSERPAFGLPCETIPSFVYYN